MPPPMMATEGIGREVESSEVKFAYHLYHGLDVVHGSFGQNTVAQIKNMARTRSGALQNFRHAHLQFGQGCKQRHRVQIALDRRSVADVHPRLIDIDAPINTHHIAAGGVKLAEKTRSSRAE